MRDLAQISLGRPYHLRSTLQLHEFFAEELGISVREVITDLEAKVAQVKGVTLTSVTRVVPSLSEVTLGAQPFRLGNIERSNFTVFVFEFTIAGLPRPVSRVRLAQLNLQGSLPGFGRREELAPQELYATFSDDESAVASIDPEVLGYVQNKNVDHLLQKAVGQVTVNASQARQTLQVALGMTQRIGNAALTKVLNNALDELNKTGTISAGTRKTVALGGRTKTVKPAEGVPLVDGLSQEEIRKTTGL